MIIENKDLKSDPINFIKDVEHILTDNRYITKDGKPVLTVYSSKNLSSPERYITIWRNYFQKKYHKDLYIVAIVGDDLRDPREMGFDIGADFFPMTTTYKKDMFNDCRASLEAIDKEFRGYALDYGKLVKDKRLVDYYRYPVIDALSPSWDNDARRRGQADSFSVSNSNPELYGVWLRRLLAKKGGSEFIFVNAWNEWAEGAVMEPTLQYGRAVLNETVNAILDSRTKQ